MKDTLEDFTQMEKDCKKVLHGDITKLPTTPISELKKIFNGVKKAESLLNTLLKAVRR